MHDHVRAARAYSANSAHRSQRDQDADIFRTAAAGLRHSGTTGSIGYSRALEDNKRLWASTCCVTPKILCLWACGRR
jgi:hypothetical protein